MEASPRAAHGRSRACVAAALLALSACATQPRLVAPQVQADAKRLGAAEGTACGSMLIGPSGYNFLPVLLTDRFERAYQNAVQSVPGATAVAEVNASEYWFFWGVGRTFCTTIRGEAVRG